MVVGIPQATKENKYTKIEKREAKSQELRTWLSHLQTDESIIQFYSNTGEDTTSGMMSPKSI